MFSNNEMDFPELIQSYFLKRTGKGLIFSSRDLDLLLKWEASGCSAGTICKGIDAAVERANRIPRDLFSCRKYIEEGMGSKKSQTKPPLEKKAVVLESSVNNGEREALLGMVKHFAQNNPHSDFQELYAQSLRDLSDANFDLDIFEFEDSFYEKAFLSLCESAQKDIDEEILKTLNAVLLTMSPKARSATISAKRRAYLERKMSNE